jgi:hypothetical protein
MPPTSCPQMLPGTLFQGKLRRTANAIVTDGFKCAPLTEPIKWMIAITMIPGATTIMPKVTRQPLTAATTLPPAATNTNRYVPQASAKTRRHSSDVSKKSGADCRWTIRCYCAAPGQPCPADFIPAFYSISYLRCARDQRFDRKHSILSLLDDFYRHVA